jgi:hypothetical protein
MTAAHPCVIRGIFRQACILTTFREKFTPSSRSSHTRSVHILYLQHASRKPSVGITTTICLAKFREESKVMALRLTAVTHRRRVRQRRKRFSAAWFNWVHSHHLIYNACWEDPRLDRIALNAGAHDTMLTITSAGCNTLDYALLEPRHIYAVDLNYRQNALLELKLVQAGRNHCAV